MSRHHLWAEPFLWIHAAGIATVPLWVLVVLVGLATGDPLLPVGLEKLLVELAVLPVVWMQAWRPFYIFSLVAVSVPSEQLDERRRQVLAGFQQPLYRFVVLPLVSVLVVGYVGWSYDVAPLFASLSPIHQAPGSRVMGLLIAVVGVLGLTLFAQVPAAVGLLLMHSDDEAQSWLPVPTDRIPSEFSGVGRPLEKFGDMVAPLAAGIPARIPQC
ncbi:MAG: low-complexity tail membrane protein [Synechococcaceae cyanobacterium SM2_3_2]|nr:low-complexity tail membrane protein [Synechococcaceae cyanobacterium SM2_3_2]